MSSGFKNFFITFILCLLIFGFVGFKVVYPMLKDTVRIDEVITPDTSANVSESDESQTVSETVSTPVVDDTYDPDGDIFTAAVICVDDNGKALACSIIDSNGKSKQYIVCSVPITIKVTNEVGQAVPLSDMIPMLNDTGVCSVFSALTGFPVDYCVRVDRKTLASFASRIGDATVDLSEDISFVNPKYADFEPEEGEEYPDDYYINLSDGGKVRLSDRVEGRTKLEWLLEYNPNVDGSPYNAIYVNIAKSVYQQFFRTGSKLKSTSTITSVATKSNSNISTDDATANLDAIFAFDSLHLNLITYPGNWEKGVETFRKLDGRRE